MKTSTRCIVGLAACVSVCWIVVDASETAEEYTGTYYIAIGHSPQFTLELDPIGAAVEFRITGKNLDLSGTGAVDGSDMTLAADLGETGDFSASVTFVADGTGFVGRWEIVGPNPVQGTLTGTTSPWPTFDLEALGVPHLAVAGGIDLLRIGRVSRFRSGEGHDYSDELESCRSMKHYFEPKPGVRHDSIRLFSPVAGTIVGTTDEWDGPTLWKGQAVGIRPDGWPAFDIVIFHLDPRRPLPVGAPVAAGEELGTSQKTSGTAADIAVGVHTPQGYRLISLFEVMTDAVFRRYRECGADARSDFVISKSERDADPLTCDGEQFADRGALQGWIELLASPVPRRPSSRRLAPTAR